MNARFKKLIQEARRSDLPAALQLWGDRPDLKCANAIDADWLHVLLTAVTDITEAQRVTEPEEEVHARRKTRRNLALLIAIAEEWEKRL